jgi:hypothetical protein
MRRSSAQQARQARSRQHLRAAECRDHPAGCPGGLPTDGVGSVCYYRPARRRASFASTQSDVQALLDATRRPRSNLSSTPTHPSAITMLTAARRHLRPGDRLHAVNRAPSGRRLRPALLCSLGRVTSTTRDGVVGWSTSTSAHVRPFATRSPSGVDHASRASWSAVADRRPQGRARLVRWLAVWGCARTGRLRSKVSGLGGAYAVHT